MYMLYSCAGSDLQQQAASILWQARRGQVISQVEDGSDEPDNSEHDSDAPWCEGARAGAPPLSSGPPSAPGGCRSRRRWNTRSVHTNINGEVVDGITKPMFFFFIYECGMLSSCFCDQCYELFLSSKTNTRGRFQGSPPTSHM